MKNLDNPPAFPCACASGDKHHIEDGMSLLDHFAGLALQGILSNGADPSNEPTKKDTELVAEWAYQFSIAMLAEREKYAKQ